MGYTHYWTPNQHPNEENKKSAFDACSKILTQCSEIIAMEYNTSAKHPALCSIDDNLIRFNGIGEDGHETFVFITEGDWGFCKTNNKPYDCVVTACLIVLSHFGLLVPASDGEREDWKEGLALARTATGISNLEIPKEI